VRPGVWVCVLSAALGRAEQGGGLLGLFQRRRGFNDEGPPGSNGDDGEMEAKRWQGEAATASTATSTEKTATRRARARPGGARTRWGGTVARDGANAGRRPSLGQRRERPGAGIQPRQARAPPGQSGFGALTCTGIGHPRAVAWPCGARQRNGQVEAEGLRGSGEAGPCGCRALARAVWGVLDPWRDRDAWTRGALAFRARGR
jgi:hypothetical protein